MKKLITIVFCFILTALLLSGCVSVNLSPLHRAVTGKGIPESYEYKVGEITDIKVELLCDIRYYSGTSDYVTLEIQPNLRDHIVVEENGGVLRVQATRNISWNGRTPVLTVSTPALKSLSFAGAGFFTTYDTITAETFDLKLYGAAGGQADFAVDKLFVDMAGAADISLSGSADSADFNLAGAGRLDALALETRVASIDLAGVGTVRVNCSESMRIFAGGLGSVEYTGSPSIDLSRGGLVSITKLN